MAEELTRGELSDLLTGFALTNPRCREELLRDPRAVLEGLMNTRLPEALKVVAVEETADVVYVVVPWVAPPKGDLSDAELEGIAGGKSKGKQKPINVFCNNGKGGFNTRTEFHASVKLV